MLIHRPFILLQINGLFKVKAIAAGDYHAVAIASEFANKGVLYGWGLQYSDSTLSQFANKPKKMGNINVTVTSVACGSCHTLCIGYGHRYADGIPYSCGRGTRGQLGLGNTDTLSRIRRIYTLCDAGKVVQKVSAGKKHSAFLTTEGEVFTCGCNWFGQLGYFTEEEYSVIPVNVDLGKNAANVKIRCATHKALFVQTAASLFVVKQIASPFSSKKGHAPHSCCPPSRLHDMLESHPEKEDITQWLSNMDYIFE